MLVKLAAPYPVCFVYISVSQRLAIWFARPYQTCHFCLSKYFSVVQNKIECELLHNRIPASNIQPRQPRAVLTNILLLELDNVLEFGCCNKELCCTHLISSVAQIQHKTRDIKQGECMYSSVNQPHTRMEANSPGGDLTFCRQSTN
jgi:hypothetical protein